MWTRLDTSWGQRYDDSMDTFIPTRLFLEAVPELKESHLRSMIRRKFLIPKRLGGFFVFTQDDVEKVKSFKQSTWKSNHVVC